MAEQTTPLAATLEEFDRARGDDMDGVWAFSVSWSLIMRDVDPGLVREGVAEALAVVRQTQESPQDLFGPPRDHADALYDQWLSEGRLVLDARVTSWSGAVRLGLVLSAAYVTLFLVVDLLRGEATAAGLIRVAAISLVAGLGSMLAYAAWERRHRPRGLAVDASTDLRWSVELTEILRTRHSMSGPRVRGIVSEALAHAAEAGRLVQEEFGTPEEYAARFAPDVARRCLLTSALLGVLALVNVILLIDEPHWSNAALLVGFGWLAIAEHRKYRALRAR
ncbi:putative membrane-anchored protein [Nocardioides sp. BE266]|uniref:hypothetical protein n=1 Tax=Nocardioides sp. BE266 TaxID=2817725 RepID=UPI00285540DB|nr:hypothetical protein [Nocardioides sp. BE266]MDR7253153.1 putative membrane-anchored protein [Nocardioides sp. BE266]